MKENKEEDSITKRRENKKMKKPEKKRKIEKKTEKKNKKFKIRKRRNCPRTKQEPDLLKFLPMQLKQTPHLFLLSLSKAKQPRRQ